MRKSWKKSAEIVKVVVKGETVKEMRKTFKKEKIFE